MTGRDRFLAAVPELLALAQARNLRIGIEIRQALMDLWHYECPIGLTLNNTWVFVIADKLESPNKFRAGNALDEFHTTCGPSPMDSSCSPIETQRWPALP